ncbi:chemotaxis protein CheX [Cellulomonas sp. NTE-D12]|uniref:chemotaxis protein CheX n=1 Tax=Cellulomonas sp. NTE-D12 TaxID=2962632 RepID=UPI00308154DE|nr:hypothetical protein CELD12_28960 [Cellulomonas sp. NTE-D12]
MSAIAHDEVQAIAQEVFAAMIDGEPESLVPWPDAGTGSDAVVAWVDVHGPWLGRASLETSTPAAHELARALLSMEADETVPREDVVDALGELANVVGGNVKALLPEHGTLGLPKVADRLPDGQLAAAVQRVPLAWRGHPFVVTVWEVAEPTGSVREGER